MALSVPNVIGGLKESVSGSFRRWLSKEHIRATVFCGGLLALEELLQRMVITAAGFTGTKAVAYKHLHRLLFSGIYYVGVSRLGYKTEALISSTIPLALSFVDGISTIMGATPEEVGAAAGEKLSMWLGTAKLALTSRTPTKVTKFQKITQTQTQTEKAELPEGVTISKVNHQRM